MRVEWNVADDVRNGKCVCEEKAFWLCGNFFFFKKNLSFLLFSFHRLCYYSRSSIGFLVEGVKRVTDKRRHVVANIQRHTNVVAKDGEPKKQKKTWIALHYSTLSQALLIQADGTYMFYFAHMLSHRRIRQCRDLLFCFFSVAIACIILAPPPRHQCPSGVCYHACAAPSEV